jgi:hypothetical protein
MSALTFAKDLAASNKYQNVYSADTGHEGVRFFAVEYTGEAETTNLILAKQSDLTGSEIIWRGTFHNLTDALDHAELAHHYAQDLVDSFN